MRLELWSNLECASGVRLAIMAFVLPGSMVSVTLDHNDSLTVVVPWDATWLTEVRQRRVVRYTDELGRVSEWRITDIDDSRAQGEDATVTITCGSVLLDLRSAGFMFDTVNGRRTYNLGAELATDENYVKTFVLAHGMTAFGATWWAAGNFDFTDSRNIAWDRWTPLQLLQHLAEVSGGELNIRRNGSTNYLIDILAARGSSAAQVLMRTDRQVLSLQRKRTSETLVTSVLPAGGVPEGDVDAADLGRAAWKVSAISSDLVTLEDPNMGEPPIAFNDQFNGLYLLKPDATLTLVDDTLLATQQLDVASATGLSVGDHIEIRADSSGTLLTQLTNPAAVALYGTIVGTVEDGEARGERNHVGNPFGSDWTFSGDGFEVHFGRIDGSHVTTTTINLKELPVGLVIPVDDWLVFTGDTAVQIDTGDTVDGGGLATVIVDTAQTLSDNTRVWIHKNTVAPTDWSIAHGPATVRSLYNRTAGEAQADLTGAVMGAGQTNVAGVIADGLTNDALIQAGDVLVTGGSGYTVRGPVTVNGSGQARIPLNRSFTAADNDAITITRPTHVIPGTNVLLLPPQGSARVIQWPAYKVHVPAGGTLEVHAQVSIGYMAPEAFDFGAVSSTPAVMIIRNADTLAALATVTDIDFSMVQGEYVPVILQTSATLSASTNILVELQGVTGVTGFDWAGTENAPHLFVLWAMLHIGSDPGAPPIDGSHANRLWNLANVKLAELSVQPFTLTATAVDLARANPDFAAEALEIGQSVRMIAVDMAGGAVFDEVVRIVGMRSEINADGALDTSITFATIDPRIAKLQAEQRAKKLYAIVDGVIGTTTDKAPVAQEGAIRARRPPGTLGDDPGDTELDLSPYEGPV